LVWLGLVWFDSVWFGLVWLFFLTLLTCSKLVNVIAPGTIDERLIKKNMGVNAVYQQHENLNHALDGCKRIGLQVSTIGVPDLLGGAVWMDVLALFLLFLLCSSSSFLYILLLFLLGCSLSILFSRVASHDLGTPLASH
jgi:hypothetical protein